MPRKDNFVSRPCALTASSHGCRSDWTPHLTSPHSALQAFYSAKHEVILSESKALTAACRSHRTRAGWTNRSVSTVIAVSNRSGEGSYSNYAPLFPWYFCTFSCSIFVIMTVFHAKICWFCHVFIVFPHIPVPCIRPRKISLLLWVFLHHAIKHRINVQFIHRALTSSPYPPTHKPRHHIFCSAQSSRREWNTANFHQCTTSPHTLESPIPPPLRRLHTCLFLK